MKSVLYELINAKGANMQIEDLMFALLRFEFFGVELSLEECENIRGLGEEESEKLFALSKKHDMAHAVANALFKNGLISLESPLHKHYAKEQLLSVFRYENQTHELEKIRAILTENKIAFIPLKGAIIRKYYKDPSLRTGCDIDVLIKHDDLKRAVKLLCDKLQYTLDEKEYFHDVTLHSASDVTIELHFSIQEGINPMDTVLGSVWEHAFSIEDGGVEYALTNEFLMFHVIAHTAYHFVAGGCGVKPFIDLLVLRNSLEFSQSDLDELLNTAELKLFYQSMQTVAGAWFCGEEKTELVKQVQEFLLKGGVYGTKENGIAVKRAKDTSKAKYLLGRIFLSYTNLKTVFPVLKKHKWLFPFCQVARWFKIIFSKRIKTATKEFSVNAKLSNEESQQTKALLDQLGL